MRFKYLAPLTLSAIFLAAAAPPRPYAQQVLRDQCLLFAADPTNPWALAHGITAFGPTFAAKDGRKASEVIVHDFLLHSAPDAGPGTSYSFVRYAPDGTPIEPHTNLVTKTLVLAGLPISTRFKTAFGPVTLEQLVGSVKASFRHVPSSEDYWRDVAWTLDLLSHQLPRSQARFTTGDGKTVDVNQVMDDALRVPREGRRRPAVRPRAARCPRSTSASRASTRTTAAGCTWSQAVLSWARFPEVRKAWGARFDTQVEVLFYRLDSEWRQYEAALAQAPQYRLQLLHPDGEVLRPLPRDHRPAEGRDRLEADRLRRSRRSKRAKALLDAAVRELDEEKAFESMDELKTSQHAGLPRSRSVTRATRHTDGTDGHDSRASRRWRAVLLAAAVGALSGCRRRAASAGERGCKVPPPCPKVALHLRRRARRQARRWRPSTRLSQRPGGWDALAARRAT